MSLDGTLPPGVTMSEINSAFAAPKELPCGCCGEWFLPVEDIGTCERCKKDQEE
jgi:hypothetical protein